MKPEGTKRPEVMEKPEITEKTEGTKRPEVMEKPMSLEIYLDNSATTRCDKEVANLVTECMLEDYANPSSAHRKGFEAEKRVKQAAERIAETLKVLPREILFTSGATESDNMALIGCAHALEKEGRHLITTKIEHPAIGKAMLHLEKEGFEVTYLPVDSLGRISITDLKAALRPDTILVSIMMVNNEMGAVEPLSQAGSVIAEFNRANHASVLFHTDAVQGYGKLPIDVKGWKIDLLSVSAHKCNGPKGVGFLYIKEGMRIKPLLYGGGQQGGLRSGTLNVPGIAGMGLAAEKAYASLDRNVTFLYDLKSYFCKKIKENLDDIRVNGSCFWDGDTASFEKEKWKEAPHILSLSVRGVRAEVLLHALEDKGIYVSAGSACSTNHPGLSGTLKAIGLPEDLLESTIRLSMSHETTKQELDMAVAALSEIVPVLRRFTRR